MSERSERTDITSERSERPNNSHERTGERSERTDRNGETVRYLSLQWITELSREVAESEQLATLAADHSIGLTQVVTDGPEGTITYHLEVRDGDARFGAGPAARED
ncbi:MAG TPA: hypothetical protein VFV63_12735, partial [Ilumatobacteraceae bacterium]|nr:hypothetical protein [Ilumatobacteraceae bacterium]